MMRAFPPNGRRLSAWRRPRLQGSSSHACVATARRSKGLGSILLDHLLHEIRGLILVGTWAATAWAIRFYERHGFRQVTPEANDRLLRVYWAIPERQVETSVVLAIPSDFA
jgi:ribosomal protein S18 acetylase RimI-like enzyme